MKLQKKAEQIVKLWDETNSKQDKIDLLHQALRLSASEILDWATKHIKPYETKYDDGQLARKYMDVVSKFKEEL
jgi:hypothetical protein